MSAIIGTAGHIDHGKTALVRALTGIETDRLKEERARGISIDLGFAHFDTGTEQAGVIDVPGHERFIRNMVAGAHGIDLVLLVVAADDGVMPQTQEHLDILNLLGVRGGIVVMTKIDLVPPARRAAVREEIDILVAGTSLENAPIHAVSVVTGDGLETLRAAIIDELRRCVRPAPLGYFRLPVDRAFAMRGHGLVVTGTATAGSIATEATVRILPGLEEARVRGIQVHARSVDVAGYGQRIALNLTGVEHTDVGRGAVVCDPQLDRVTDRFDARVEVCAGTPRPLNSHTRVRVHLGTTEVMGTLVWLGGRAEPSAKGQGFAQIALREPIAAFGGDRFILRDHTARRTIAGGVVLHPFARPLRRRGRRLEDGGGAPDGHEAHVAGLQTLAQTTEPLVTLTTLLDLEPATAISPEYLANAASMRVDLVRALFAAQAAVRMLPDPEHAEAYISPTKWRRLADAVRESLAAYHESVPRQPGLEMESLRSQIAADLSPKMFRAVVDELQREQVLVREDSRVRLPSHPPGLHRQDASVADQVDELLDQAGYTPPDIKDLEKRLAIDRRRLQDVLAQLERDGRIARVAPDLCFASAAVERARDLVRAHVASHGEITAAAFRDRLGASRKFSIALLNYFDRTGFTVRVGDVRRLRRRTQ